MRSLLLSLAVRYQILLIIGSVVILAFLMAFLCSLFFDVNELRANTDLISSVYQVLGTIYAILLTFTLWEIWQNYAEADLSVQTEAYAILNLVHMIEASDKWNINIRQAALNYLNLIIDKEWPHLKNITTSYVNIQTNDAAVGLLRVVQGITPRDDREVAIFNQSLTLLNEWLNARRTRILMAAGNSAKAIWPLLLTGAFVLFAFHGLFVAKTLGIWIILLFGTSLVIGLAFYLIFTLDSPFTGLPSVNYKPFSLAMNVLLEKNN